MLHVVLLREEEDPSADEVLGQLQSLQEQFPKMRIRQRPLAEETELASRLGVVASPAIVVNGQLAFQGHPDDHFLQAYLKNVEQGLHDDPDAYPPDDERDPENRGQEATGSADPEFRGSGLVPAGHAGHSGRHS